MTAHEIVEALRAEGVQCGVTEADGHEGCWHRVWRWDEGDDASQWASPWFEGMYYTRTVGYG